MLIGHIIYIYILNQLLIQVQVLGSIEVYI